MAVRSTQEIVEVSGSRNDAEVRATQEVIEASGQRDDNEVRSTQEIIEVSARYVSPIYAEGCVFGNGGESMVIPSRGDRSAWRVSDYPTRHAQDIDDDTLNRYHRTDAQVFTLIEVDDTDSPYTASAPDNIQHVVILADTSSGNITLNLPAISSVDGTYSIKNVGGGTLTVDPNGAETIDGDATVTLSEYEAIRIVASSSEWSIL